MKNENYITVQGWMVKELGLKGNELLIYALIYGFSQDEQSAFCGSSSYIAKWFGLDKKTIFSKLNYLCERGLVTKTEKIVNGVKLCDYKANITGKEEYNGGSGEITPPVEFSSIGSGEITSGGGGKKSPGGSGKIPPHINNIDIDILDNKEKESVEEKENCEIEVDVDYFMKTWNGPFRKEIEDCTTTIVNFYEERIDKLKKAVKIVTPLLVGEWENFTPERYILRRVKHEILNSSYLKGYKETSRRVSVDFVLDNLEKILEGFYKD